MRLLRLGNVLLLGLAAVASAVPVNLASTSPRAPYLVRRGLVGEAGEFVVKGAVNGLGAAAKGTVRLAGAGLRQIPRLVRATGSGIRHLPGAVAAVGEGLHRVRHTAGAVAMDGTRWSYDKTLGSLIEWAWVKHGDRWVPFTKQILPWMLAQPIIMNLGSAGYKISCLTLRSLQTAVGMTEQQRDHWALDSVGGETCMPGHERIWKPFD
jgi:hypothetical protein